MTIGIDAKRQSFAGARGAAQLSFQEQARRFSDEESRGVTAADPDRTSFFHPHDRARREPAHAIRRRKDERRLLALSRARQTHPCGLRGRTAKGGKPELHRDEREPRREQHLRGGKRLLYAARTRPQDPLELDARFARRLRIEMPASIDERRRVSRGRRRRERGHDDREASGRSPPDELRQPAARKAAAEQPVDRIESRRQRRCTRLARRHRRRDVKLRAEPGEQSETRRLRSEVRSREQSLDRERSGNTHSRTLRRKLSVSQGWKHSAQPVP